MKTTKSPKSNPTAPNNEPNNPLKPNKQLTTLTEFYAHWYQTLFKKLPQDEQDELTKNLTKTEMVIRGSAVQFSNVRLFIKSVIEKSEEEYDKYVAKKAAKTTPATEVSKPEVDTGQK